MSEPEIHIASFVIQHREGAGPALAAAVAMLPDLELAIAGPTRSVVLCESADGRAALDRIEQLKDVAGEIHRRRAEARRKKGWIMDTYLIRKIDRR